MDWRGSYGGRDPIARAGREATRAGIDGARAIPDNGGMGGTGRKRIAVIGGGVIGVTSAYELARRGHAVTLFEAREGVGLETSYANGSILTPSMSDPWNGPGVHRHLAASLFDPYSPMKLRPRALPGLAIWGLHFLRNSSCKRHGHATDASYQLSAYSVRLTAELRGELDLAYDASDRGIVKLFRDRRAMAEPAALAERLASQGLVYRVLDPDQTVALEPALAPIGERIAGAMHFNGDESGDAYLFTKALAEHFEQLGGVVCRGVRVDRIRLEGGAVSGLETEGAFETADQVVVAAGCWSPALVAHLGISVPVKPAKGYSLTFPGDLVENPPRLPVVDDAMHALVVPVGRRLRIAGTAEFAGFDTRLRPERIENLRMLLAGLYPQIAAALPPDAGEPWTGLRPMTADGLPIIGPTPIPGLFLNTGHGHLGWTMAAGSARLLADQLEDRAAEIPTRPYRVDR